MEREKLIAEFARIGEAIRAREDGVLRFDTRTYRSDRMRAVGFNMCKLMVDVFDAVYRRGETVSSAHSVTVDGFRKTIGKAFGLTVADNVTVVFAPEHNYDLFLSGVIVDGDMVAVTTQQWVTLAPVVTRKPKQKWVKIDESTRKLQPVLKDGVPVFETSKGEAKNERINLTYRFPISFFMDLLSEIGLNSIIEAPPEGYIPNALSFEMTNMLASILATSGPRMMTKDRRGPPGFSDPEFFWMGHGLQLRGEPFRIFLKPEPGTDRMEVQIERYTKEENRAHEEFRDQRRRWANWQIKSTATYKAFEASLRERCAPAPAVSVAVA